MHIDNGENTLVHFRRGEQDILIAVDDETYATFLNEEWKVVEEICRFTRLPQDPMTGYYDPSLRSDDANV